MYNIEELTRLTEKLLGSTDIEQGPENLYAPIRYTFALGGKRIRPVMALMACNVFTDNIEPAYPVAAAVEVFHNFSLVHDDIMDKARVRRGKECVHVRWNENTAILSGDAMLILAYKVLEGLGPEMLPRLLPVFNRMAMEVCEGQQYDMDYESRDNVTVGEYMEMIRLKTSVLLAGALRMGALAGGASEVQADKLYRFGIELGLAFQLQDDLLDVYADSADFGKRVGGDIIEGKKTFLLITALSRAGARERERLFALMADKAMDSGEKIAEVKEIYDGAGVPQITREEIGLHIEKALAALRDVDVPAERRGPLESLVRSLTDRRK